MSKHKQRVVYPHAPPKFDRPANLKGFEALTDGQKRLATALVEECKTYLQRYKIVDGFGNDHVARINKLNEIMDTEHMTEAERNEFRAKFNINKLRNNSVTTIVNPARTLARAIQSHQLGDPTATDIKIMVARISTTPFENYSSLSDRNKAFVVMELDRFCRRFIALMTQG